MGGIGILGGTFDPIHNGHLNIALAAYKNLNLNKVIFVPTGVSYMKYGVSDKLSRYEMTQIAIEDYDFFEISNVEINREGNTYTCDTIKYFKDIYPKEKLYFIIGTDSLFVLTKWKDYDYIFSNCTICVSHRTDENMHKEKEYAEELNQNGADIIFVESNVIDVSSTEIRDAYAFDDFDKIQKLLVPDKVKAYIASKKLYNNQEDYIMANLRKDLKPSRLKHTIGVRDEAVMLANIYGCSIESANIAALLHDCAKYLGKDEKKQMLLSQGIDILPCEEENDELLHGKAGAVLAKEKYGIDDEDIYNAIFYHTTGRPGMSLLEQIIFVSDYIEINRTHSDKLPLYREMVKEDLNKCTAHILQDTLEYLSLCEKNSGLIISPLTKDTFEFYKKYLN